MPTFSVVWASPFKPESEVGRGGHRDYVAQSIQALIRGRGRHSDSVA